MLATELRNPQVLRALADAHDSWQKYDSNYTVKEYHQMRDIAADLARELANSMEQIDRLQILLKLVDEEILTCGSAYHTRKENVIAT